MTRHHQPDQAAAVLGVCGPGQEPVTLLLDHRRLAEPGPLRGRARRRPPTEMGGRGRAWETALACRAPPERAKLIKGMGTGPDRGGAAAAHRAAAVPAADGGRFTGTVAEGGGRVDVRRVSPSGVEVWARGVSTEAENAVTPMHAEGRVYAALYTDGATGSRVLALDADTGELLWERRAQGAGAIGHSKYANVVELAAKPGIVVVSGRESAGEFREELDAATGRSVGSGARP